MVTLSVNVFCTNACRNASSLAGFSSTPALVTCCRIEASTTCCRRIRERSDCVSPATLRARTRLSACSPPMTCSPPVATIVCSSASTIGPQMFIEMPPSASTMARKPAKSMPMTRSIGSPVRSCTARTVHCGPPTEYAELMCQVSPGLIGWVSSES